MDILYQIYVQNLENAGIHEAVAIILWYVFLFFLTVIAITIINLLMAFLEKKYILPFVLRNKLGNNFSGVPEESKANEKECAADVLNKDNKILLLIALALVLVPALMLWGMVPYSSNYVFVPSGVNSLLFLSIIILPLCGILLAGLAGNNKFSINGAMRGCVMALSYGIPVMISVISVVVLSSSLNINEIILSQSVKAGLLGWYFIPAFIGFIVFLTGVLAQIYFVSKYLPVMEKKNADGGVEYFGINPLVVKLIGNPIIFIISLFFVCLFLGGYLPPFGFYLSEVYQINYIFNNMAVYFEQIFWLISKTSIVVFFIMWLCAILPAIKESKAVKFAWRWLIPLSLLNFFVVCLIKYIAGGLAA